MKTYTEQDLIEYGNAVFLAPKSIGIDRELHSAWTALVAGPHHPNVIEAIEALVQRLIDDAHNKCDRTRWEYDPFRRLYCNAKILERMILLFTGDYDPDSVVDAVNDVTRYMTYPTVYGHGYTEAYDFMCQKLGIEREEP